MSPRGRGLLGYALGRLASTAAIVLLALALLFSLTLLVPGDPASTLLGPRATPDGPLPRHRGRRKIVRRNSIASGTPAFQVKTQ